MAPKIDANSIANGSATQNGDVKQAVLGQST